MDEQTGEEIIEDSSENGEICIKQKTERDLISNLLQNVHIASFVLLRRKIAVVCRGHSRWGLVYVKSEQALLNTTEVTGKQCNVSFGWHPTSDLTYVWTGGAESQVE